MQWYHLSVLRDLYTHRRLPVFAHSHDRQTLAGFQQRSVAGILFTQKVNQYSPHVIGVANRGGISAARRQQLAPQRCCGALLEAASAVEGASQRRQRRITPLWTAVEMKQINRSCWRRRSMRIMSPQSQVC
jgi:Liver-expressed antimicrobial peptide 2 precursor (LEAP-2)